MALHGRRNHSGKRSICSARRSLNFECLERRNLLSAVGYPAPSNDHGLAGQFADAHAGRSDHADTTIVEAAVVITTNNGVESITLGYWVETQFPDTPPAAVVQTPSKDTQPPAPPVPPAANLSPVPPPDSGVGYEGDPPVPHLSSVPAGPATPTADPSTAQSAKDGILALTDTASANGRFSDAPAGNETSPGTGNVSAESDLSAAANSIQNLGNPVDGVADVSGTSAMEGGFIAVNDGTSTATRIAINSNAPSRADLGNIDSGPAATDVASGTHKAAPQAAGNWNSSGKAFVSDAYWPSIRQAASQTSLDATEGGRDRFDRRGAGRRDVGDGRRE